MKVAGPRIFLLSPADSSAKRARQLQRPEADHDLARRLRAEAGAPLGEVFAFLSSLYFRGKLAYARAFARPPQGQDGIWVITPCAGLRTPESRVSLADLRRYGEVPVDAADERYRVPFLRDLLALAPSWSEAEVVLLGSVASGKYTELLTQELGARLLFPPDFVGRGDMSRGGLLLRCVQDGRELPYVPLIGATLRGKRPPRLPPAALTRLDR